MAGVHLDRIFERKQLVEHAAIEICREALRLLNARKVRTTDAAHEERIARQDEPGIIPSRAVADEVANALRRVARRVQNPDVIVAELDLIAVAEAGVAKHEVRCLVVVDRGAASLGQRLRGRRMVGLDVRLENVAD